jgi:hypothetical protein
VGQLPSDAVLAERYAAVWRVLHSWTLVVGQVAGVGGQESVFDFRSLAC